MNVSFRSPSRPNSPADSSRNEVDQAFTLIEILAVVAVAAILAALLFPMAKRMIESSQRAACMGNLRQLGAGIHLFAAENNGFLPWAAVSSSIRWETQIQPYLGEYKTWDKNQTKWTKSGPYSCPATAKNYWLGYGWNYQGLGMSPTDPRGGPTRAGDKARVVMLADSIRASYPEIKLGEVDMIYPKSGGMKIPRPHNEGLNTLFVDGHVEWYPADTWYESTKWQ